MPNTIPKRFENASYDDVPQDIKEAFEKIKETRKGLYIHGGVGTGKTHIAYTLFKQWEEERAKEENKYKDVKNSFCKYVRDEEEQIQNEVSNEMKEEYKNLAVNKRFDKCVELREQKQRNILSYEVWLKKNQLIEPAEPRKSSTFWGITNLLISMRREMNDPEIEEQKKLHNRAINSEQLVFIDDLGTEKMTEWVGEMFYMIVNSNYENEIPMIITSNYPLSKIAEKSGERIASRLKEMCNVFELKGEDKRINF